MSVNIPYMKHLDTIPTLYQQTKHSSTPWSLCWGRYCRCFPPFEVLTPSKGLCQIFPCILVFNHFETSQWYPTSNKLMLQWHVQWRDIVRLGLKYWHMYCITWEHETSYLRTMLPIVHGPTVRNWKAKLESTICSEAMAKCYYYISFAKNKHHFFNAKRNNISYIPPFQSIRFLSLCCCFLGFLHFRFPAAGDTQSPTALCQTARTARTHLWRTHLCRRFLWQP